MTPEELARRRGLPVATMHSLLAEYQFALTDEMAIVLSGSGALEAVKITRSAYFTGAAARALQQIRELQPAR